jgi:glycyl-tRNA synthetase beta chain
MSNDALLIEIGTEELPPKILKSLGEQFASNVHGILTDLGFSPDTYNWFASPRRLAILISSVSSIQPDTTVEKRGPAVSVAFDENNQPTKAALGWAKGNGISIENAQRLVTDKGEWLLHKATVKGKALREAISDVVLQSLAKLPIPKPMRWGNSPFQFIRPVHTLCIMHGDVILPASVFGVESKNLFRGHRFHGEKTFSIKHANDYESSLLAHFVVGSFSERADIIKSSLNKMAGDLGLSADYSDALLEEIASLVEWPKVMQASFEERFLAVPKEALIYTMKDDQKYVPLLNSDGSLSNQFLFVSNIDSKQPQYVIEGNEKVIRPRLADAEFFFDTDKKQTLESKVEQLASVLFQKKLGTLKDKAQRLQKASAQIAKLMEVNEVFAARAGLLAKADLMTSMVMEFPEVQGVMGKYYAQLDGEADEVSIAIQEQYLPKFSGDSLPTTAIGVCVSLADKLDTLVGIFGIEQRPKGDKDPFALRRAAIGILRIISEAKLDLDLETLVEIAASQYDNGVLVANQTEVVDFILSRFTALLQDEGVSTDVIQAVSSRRPTQPTDFVERVSAVKSFIELPEADALSAANKRVANILSKNSAEKIASDIDVSLFENEYEHTLFNCMSKVSEESDKSHTESLRELASLRAPIDAFFDNVMVLAEEPAIRLNRLSLLKKLRVLFLKTADISVLAK